MYRRDALHKRMGIVRKRLIDLNQFDVHELALSDANDAVAYAAANAEPCHLAVLRPDRIGAAD
jgi:alcohol dehydrogenase